MQRLMCFPTASKSDPAVDAWFERRRDELGEIAKHWFDVMRGQGDDVLELLHDGHPTACVGEAAFGYVNAFPSHVNVGFFGGTEIDDPAGLLEGTGKFMRHVKVRPGDDIDHNALKTLIANAYLEMKGRTPRD